MAIREPLAIARAAGGPGSPGGPAIREPLARPVTKPVVEPTALALREPSTSEAQRLQAAPNETTRLCMELAQPKLIWLSLNTKRKSCENSHGKTFRTCCGS